MEVHPSVKRVGAGSIPAGGAAAVRRAGAAGLSTPTNRPSRATSFAGPGGPETLGYLSWRGPFKGALRARCAPYPDAQACLSPSRRRPCRIAAEFAGLSNRKRGFESLQGHFRAGVEGLPTTDNRTWAQARTPSAHLARSSRRRSPAPFPRADARGLSDAIGAHRRVAGEGPLTHGDPSPLLRVQLGGRALPRHGSGDGSTPSSRTCTSRRSTDGTQRYER